MYFTLYQSNIWTYQHIKQPIQMILLNICSLIKSQGKWMHLANEVGWLLTWCVLELERIQQCQPKQQLILTPIHLPGSKNNQICHYQQGGGGGILTGASQPNPISRSGRRASPDRETWHAFSMFLLPPAFWIKQTLLCWPLQIKPRELARLFHVPPFSSLDSFLPSSVCFIKTKGGFW